MLSIFYIVDQILTIGKSLNYGKILVLCRPFRDQSIDFIHKSHFIITYCNFNHICTSPIKLIITYGIHWHNRISGTKYPVSNPHQYKTEQVW